MVAQNSILQRCFEEAASSSARALERCVDGQRSKRRVEVMVAGVLRHTVDLRAETSHSHPDLVHRKTSRKLDKHAIDTHTIDDRLGIDPNAQVALDRALGERFRQASRHEPRQRRRAGPDRMHISGCAAYISYHHVAQT